MGSLNAVQLLYSCLFNRRGKILKCERWQNDIWVTVRVIDIADGRIARYKFYLAPDRSTFMLEEAEPYEAK